MTARTLVIWFGRTFVYWLLIDIGVNLVLTPFLSNATHDDNSFIFGVMILSAVVASWMAR